jgi:hypothetical protein
MKDDPSRFAWTLALWHPVQAPLSPRAHQGAGHTAASRSSGGYGTPRPHALSVALRDYIARDADGFIGVVDEVCADGTIRIACGWFGRRHVIVHLRDIERIQAADRELVLRAAVPAIEELRAESGVAGRLAARLIGRAVTRK